MDKINSRNNPTHRKKHPLRTRRRFRLSFINENTFNEIWTLKLSQRKVVALTVLLIVALGSTIAMLIVFTPLKTLLPGYLKQSQRQENIVNSMRVDSLMTQMRISQAYNDNFRKILAGDTSSELSGETAENAPQSIDSLISASEAERKFVKQYDSDNKYNVTILSSIATDGLSLRNPLPSGSASSVQPKNLELHVNAPDKSTVTAMHQGLVIDTYYTPELDNVVIIQNQEGFVSKYSGITALFVEEGSKVSAGSALGLIKHRDGTAAKPLVLEIWNKGTKLNPADYIQW